MNTKELKHLIERGEFPKNHSHFGGAGLIITDRPSYKGHDTDLRILTSHASAFSWLVFELKEIHAANIDYQNKYDFYPTIGRLIQESFIEDGDIIDSMLYVVERMEVFWAQG